MLAVELATKAYRKSEMMRSGAAGKIQQIQYEQQMYLCLS